MASVIEYRQTTGNLGGAATATQVPAASMNNLWDDVSPSERVAGDTEYRAIDLYNSGDADAAAVTFYVEIAATGEDVQVGIEASPIDSVLSIADEATPPAGVAFAAHTSASPLALPDIPVGSGCRVWLKRVITAGAPNTANASSDMRVEYA